MAPTKKITVQEAREWVENALRNFDRDDLTKLDDALNGEGIQEFIDSFRPVASKTPKKKKSPSPKKDVIHDAPFDESRCVARAGKKDVNGWRINCQCTNAPKEGGLCPLHITKKNSKKGLELGIYTDERPSVWGDGSNIIWVDSPDEIKVTLKKKEKRKVTCGICGVVGHTKTTCPQKNSQLCKKVEEKVEEKTEEKAQEKTEEKVEENTEEKVEEKTEEKVDEKTEEKAQEKVEEKTEEKTEEKVEEKTEEKTEEKVEIITGETPDGKKYEVEIHSHPPHETAPEGFEPEPEPEPTYSPGSPKSPEDSQKTEPLSGGELEFDCQSDDEGETEKITFEHVPYDLDANEVTVYDEDGDHVGNWNGEKIIWLNSAFRKCHEVRKKEAEEEPKEPCLKSLSWKDLKNKAKELGVSPDDIEEASDLDESDERVAKIISFIQQKM